LKLGLLLPFFLLSLACPKPEPPIPPPDPSILATVKAVPENVEVTFDGKVIGQTPTNLKVSSVHQLTGKFGAAGEFDKQGVVEQRIRHISDDEVEVNLVFDRELSQMAKALGLTKILVFDYGDDITFDSNSSILKPDFMPVLERQATLIKTYFSGIDIYVCGHSDSTGRRDYNLDLSLKRAEAVYSELERLGIPRLSMKLRGFGSDYPLATNETDAGRTRNRRIEMIMGQ
jgi:outer membrane protein OmpA-like peptidoglycan-associated protein